MNTTNFPQFKGKHVNRSLIEPSDFVNYLQSVGLFPKDGAPKGAILCYDSRLMSHIRANHPYDSKDAMFFKILSLKETGGEIIVVGDFGIGAPAAVFVLENLIAYGVRKFMSIGMAGTLQKNQNIGDLVVCEKAIRDEGVSHHYAAPALYSYPDREMTLKIEKILTKFNQKYHKGSTWTIDAFFRETTEEASQYQKDGVSTVEMEAAALFAVAAHRKVEIGSVFTVSDTLAELKWAPHFSHEDTVQGLETLYRLALETLKN